MKTLTESINEIKNASYSYTRKRAEIIKLGIRPNEVALIIGRRPAPTTRRPRHIEVALEVIEEVFKFTFGVELETVGLSKYAAINEARANGLVLEHQGYNHVDSRSIYKLVSDSSIHGSNPIECVSPILESENGGFSSLETMCRILNNNGANVNRSCGTHVHIGCDGMTDEWYCNVFVNYMFLESIIDTFMARSRRGNECNWCRSLKRNKASLLAANNKNDVWYACGGTRYTKVNSEAWGRHNTIEFRQHQGTTDYEKISMWTKFCGKLVGWSKDHRLTEDVTSIEAVEFLTAEEKAFFTRRASYLNRRAA